MPVSELIYKSLCEIKDLYVEVKEAIILAENFDRDHDIYVSPLNELRNTLDHVMRSINNPEKIDQEFIEAKEHLNRAGYDAYEVLAVNIGSKIVRIIERYDIKIIAAIFPDYFTAIKKNLIEIKIDLAKIRAKRSTTSIGIASFTPYKDKMAELIYQLEMCEAHIPDLQHEKNKSNFRTFLKLIIGFIGGIVVAVLGSYFYHKFFISPPLPPH